MTKVGFLKFKVGDRVKIVNKNSVFDGVIGRVMAADSLGYRVSFRNREIYFSESELKAMK